jgi:hypothetical protein
LPLFWQILPNFAILPSNGANRDIKRHLRPYLDFSTQNTKCQFTIRSRSGLPDFFLGTTHQNVCEGIYQMSSEYTKWP